MGLVEEVQGEGTAGGQRKDQNVSFYDIGGAGATRSQTSIGEAMDTVWIGAYDICMGTRRT